MPARSRRVTHAGAPRLPVDDSSGSRGLTGLWSALLEAGTSIARQPVRTLLCAIGTVVAVAAFTATNGLGQSAKNAVSNSFNELRATTVEFQGGKAFNEASVMRLAALNGVTSAGMLSYVDQQQPLPVQRGSDAANASTSAQLSITAASPSAFQTIGATLSSGRFYDDGADRHRQMVALLGSAAASQLGISSTLGQPAIVIRGVTVTVIGIVRSTQQESQVLLSVIVPPYVAQVIVGTSQQQIVIARTLPGAAQLVGSQGPLALDPDQPSAVVAEVPPNPSTLRSQVQASLSTLLTVLAYTGLGIGLLSIGAITIMSVAQRRSEIGLRRAIGYRRAEIARLVILEAGGMGLLGGAIGTSAGVLVTVAIAHSEGWTPVMSPIAIAIAPMLGVAVGLVAGSYPAFRATTIAPMAALRE